MEQPIRVGASVSRSGELSAAGDMYEKGLWLWQRDVNARGGILGKQVELVLTDDSSIPAKAAQAYASFLERDEADVLLGPVDTQLAQAVIPVLERGQTPCVFPMPASNVLWQGGKGLVFGVLAPLAEWPAGFFEIIARAGFDRVAMVIVDHPQAAIVQSNTAKWTRRYGLNLVSESLATRVDIPQALEKARQAHSDVLTLWGAQEGCTQTLRTMKQMGWRPKAVFISSSMFQHNMREIAGRDMDGVFTARPWEARMAKSYPGGSEFVTTFRNTHGQDPETLAASAYASGQLLEAALTRAGNMEKEALRKTLTTLDAMTILGRYGVDANGMQLRQFPLTEQWQKGRREIVWPEEMRTAKPVLPR